MLNTEPRYWEETYGIVENAARILAYVAGDYANMDDTEVFATFINETADTLEPFTETPEDEK